MYEATMTTIAAWAEDGVVTMGGDSAVSCDGELYVLPEPKVVRIGELCRPTVRSSRSGISRSTRRGVSVSRSKRQKDIRQP